MNIRKPYWYLKDKFMQYCKYHNPKLYISILYHDRLRRWIDWKNPKDLNEKINWLKFYSDTSKWTLLADKYKIRDYVKECGCEEILVPLLGVWQSAKDIDFCSLPPKFVLKPNHGCGDVIVVKDKANLDIPKVCEQLDNAISNKFGYELAEWHYIDIPPVIICESLLEVDGGGDLVDYKVWCFDGSPYYIMSCSEREIKTHKTVLNLFDLEWNRLDHYMSDKYRNSKPVFKPEKLKEMLQYAKILAKPFPEVRIDFYEVNGKIYVGELTFTSRAGMMDYYTQECLMEMGSRVTLPAKQVII